MVFFTDTQRLTANSRAGNNRKQSSEPDLYACHMVEVEEAGHKQLKCDLTDLSLDTNPGEERAAVQGSVLAASEDGSYVYFVANGVLGDGAEHGATTGNADTRRPMTHTENRRKRATSTWSTTTAPPKRGKRRASSPPSRVRTRPTGDWASLGAHTSGASPDGRYLAFMSERDLTGYDTTDVSEQEVEPWRMAEQHADEEVYLYDAELATERKLVCASCNPTGARPDGERYYSATEETAESKHGKHAVCRWL